MNKDFTLTVYRQLLLEFKEKGYNFYTLSDYVKLNPMEKCLIIRHDIDKRPKNALKMAQIEANLGINASYYFRIVNKSNDPIIIKKIAKLNHEIGYHYEDLTIAKGNYKKAINSFENNLKYFRKFYPVSTICMHGSPLTRWDNRDLWKKYNYSDYNIICEPYFDINFNQIAYFTDTGRKWNSEKENIRDKVKSSYSFNFKATSDIINSINSLPDIVMINVHSQRWTNNIVYWYFELISQNIKNRIKNLIRT